MILCLLLRWQNEQKTDFNFVVITRLSTAANKKSSSNGPYGLYYPSLEFLIKRCIYTVLITKRCRRDRLALNRVVIKQSTVIICSPTAHLNPRLDTYY